MAGYIGDIDANVPGGNEDIRDGDDAIRDLAGKTHDSFPNVQGPVNKTHAELNACLQTLSVGGGNLNISDGNSIPLEDISDTDAVQLNTLEVAPIPEQHMKQTSLRVTPDASQAGAMVLDGGQLNVNAPVLKMQTAAGGSDYGLQADSDFTVAAVRGNGQGASSANHCLIGHTMTGTTGGMRATLHTAGSSPGGNSGWFIEFGILNGATWEPIMQICVSGTDKGSAWLNGNPM